MGRGTKRQIDQLEFLVNIMDMILYEGREYTSGSTENQLIQLLEKGQRNMAQLLPIINILQTRYKTK